MASIADSSAQDRAPGTAPGSPVRAGVLLAAVEAVEQLGACSADYDALTDAELLDGQRHLARLGELVETRQVWLAKTLAYRSRRELGPQGLAARQGFLSPDELIQKLTGSTRTDARKLVDVGRMLADTEAATAAAAAATAEAAAEAARRRNDDEADGPDGPEAPASGAPDRPDGDGDAGPGTPPGLFGDLGLTGAPVLPWFSAISAAVSAGALSVAAAHAMRTGLGTVDTVVTAENLADAVRTLLDDAKTMTVDALLKRSRQLRDTLDEAGIAVREQKAWDDRYLRIWRIPTGQVHVHGLFPPEQGEYLLSLHESLTGPRRGGVRFVDPDRAAWAKAVQDDPRRTEQITADGFVDLLKAGSTVNPNRMLGGRTPAVRVHVIVPPPAAPAAPQADQPPTPAANTERPASTPTSTSTPTPTPTDSRPAIPGGTGHGYLEGSTAAVSPASIDRLICDSGILQVTFDSTGQPLKLGREERVFSQAQRTALAARDGGCRWTDCDRPPSATEAHHLQQWARDHGATDIRHGILLCSPHHRLLHNQGWQILENHGRYWLKPPAAVDPDQTLIEMRSTHPATPKPDPHPHDDEDKPHPLAG
jgi:hypothetical protein